MLFLLAIPVELATGLGSTLFRWSFYDLLVCRGIPCESSKEILVTFDLIECNLKSDYSLILFLSRCSYKFYN